MSSGRTGGIVKICGITRAADARDAARAGADWLGLNFWPKSRRFVTLEQARAAAAAAREVAPEIVLVGVFVNQERDRIEDCAAALGLDRVQLHGDESPAFVAGFGARAIKAIALAGPEDLATVARFAAAAVLVDTPTAGYGGSGRTGNWALCRQAVAAGARVLLAGGLRGDNVADAVRAVRPWGVDVASGVESGPGIKDAAAMARFVAAARSAFEDDDHE
jgi:phosphoribosylanthranilate isomerase